MIDSCRDCRCRLRTYAWDSVVGSSTELSLESLSETYSVAAQGIGPSRSGTLDVVGLFVSCRQCCQRSQRACIGVERGAARCCNGSPFDDNSLEQSALSAAATAFEADRDRPLAARSPFWVARMALECDTEEPSLFGS